MLFYLKYNVKYVFVYFKKLQVWYAFDFLKLSSKDDS